ncbi:expressed unknown protein [Seminavis robusta]|uniref:DUF6697 domain-containing protein n=1 Tax=Seminavis robusta TaxID=568900 RepID=A0A9N8E6D5_9STRA|nr:expressed unknown protein [Seminavis robusta]|eukprot:Sro720_g192560.1 n/a (698) ;mRNA; r:16178-18353
MPGLVHVCRLCKNHRSAHKIKYRCGTRIERRFPDGVWYPGVIEGHEEKQEHKIINHIQYDDGDAEELENQVLRKKDTVRILTEVGHTSSNKKARRLRKAEQLQVIEIDGSDDEDHDPVPQATSSAVKQQENGEAPDEQPSGGNVISPVKSETQQGRDQRARRMPKVEQLEVIEIDDSDDDEDDEPATPVPPATASTPAAVKKQEDGEAPDEQPSGGNVISPVKSETQQGRDQINESMKTEEHQLGNGGTTAAGTVAKSEEQLQEDNDDSGVATVAKTEESEHGHTEEGTIPVAVISNNKPIKEDVGDGETSNSQVADPPAVLDSRKEDDNPGRANQHNATTPGRAQASGDGDAKSVTDSSASKEDCSTSGEEQEDSVPDNQLSEAQVIHKEVLTDLRQDAMVKAEKCTSSMSPEELQKRELCFHKWKLANTDPDTRKGRYVFRRGCYGQCITKILGGSGMDPWPIVKNPPNVNTKRAIVDWEVNPFIKPGEYYVAGNEAFNPFGPRFPGDHGFVNTAAFEVNPEQEEFHVFVECAADATGRLWHGNLAAGGRMYAGVYRRVDDDDYMESSIRFASDVDLNFHNKLSIADWFVTRAHNLHNKSLGPNVKAKHVTMAKRLREQYGKEEPWLDLKPRDRDNWTYMAYLMDTDYTMHVAPVKFVRFDEALYQSLVKFDCATSRGEYRGHVSLEKNLLQYYF